MSQKNIERLSGLIAVLLISLFTLGLAHSISTGFAGFWGGLPFVVITVFVLGLACYDYWSTCLRKRDDDGHGEGVG
ncbi:MAG: hypothetical protein VW169_16595 [Rhodospirillaceae bacterium]